MMFPSGQPLWQKGIPQSMQRAPWAWSLSRGIGFSYSRQSRTRSLTGRRAGVSRSISRKPPSLPIQPVTPELYFTCPRSIAVQLLTPSLKGKGDGCRSDRGQLRRFGVEMLAFEHLAVFGRQDLDELARVLIPTLQHTARHFALRVLQVARDQRMHLAGLGLILEAEQLHHAGVAAP